VRACPVIAAAIIGTVGDVARFGDRDRFAACNGTAPIEVSSGERKIHRLSLRGNRRLNLVDEGHSRLVVNLGSVSFIDSTGLGVLVGVWHRLSPNDGVLALAAPSAEVRGLLEATSLSKPFSICENTAEAVQACRPAG
jgi:anti-anti-sigma regulatory factor